ncbi:hypothetical protein L1987_34959 [Smallanthus sonchifolius]|uniref:Uncharacterized protein n=1 Tax=Smallanthus sonchifolius TaxID=185202 RepID=A0ACB9HWP4_9ASTR|nr:hypothetical protein L1987_34959 [Smallanthus sonchifolius]
MKRIGRGSYGYGHSHGYGGQEQEDRLSSLSDDILICILSYVDTKLAVQSSILSKRWEKVWTSLPVLNFNSAALDTSVHDVNSDNLIREVLAHRNKSVMIDRLNIKVTDYEIVARVFRYALLNNVSDLSIDTSEKIGEYHPISCVNSSDLLMNLSLKGMLKFGKFPSFDGLVSLRLERVKIVEYEPFSCFPNLEKLFLVNCKMEIGLTGLEVVASRLSRLTISSCFHIPIPYPGLVLSTPNLLVFELEGLIPMSFKAFDGLRRLQTVYIDFCFSQSVHLLEFDQQKLNLIDILGCLKNAECVHLSPSTVELLSLCGSMLVEEHCPFEDLKFLNLIPPPNKPAAQLGSSVAAYLLKDCPRAVVKALPR